MPFLGGAGLKGPHAGGMSPQRLVLTSLAIGFLARSKQVGRASGIQAQSKDASGLIGTSSNSISAELLALAWTRALLLRLVDAPAVHSTMPSFDHRSLGHSSCLDGVIPS